MNNYNYSERITQNEQRIAELKGKVYVAKKSIIALEKENERCVEAMNNCTQSIDIHKNNRENTISYLENELSAKCDEVTKLKKENLQLKHDLQVAKNKLNEKNLKKICNAPRNDVILADDFGDNNIFEEIAGKPAKDMI